MNRRAAILVVALGALLTAPCLLLAGRIRSDSSATVFLREDDPARRAYEAFVRDFGGDDVVLFTCRGDGGAAFRSRAAEFASAAGGILPTAISPLATALRLVDAEGRRISIPVPLRGDPATEVGRLQSIADGFPDLDPKIAGGAILNLALGEASDDVARRLFPLLVLMMAALVFAAYRSVRTVVAIFATALVALLFGMALVALSGRPVNLVTVLLPVLLLSLSVALCVHLLNAYRTHRAAGLSPDDAVRAMRRDEWRPCLVTTLTTSAGFGSFVFSRIEPLQVLGGAMGISFLAALGIAFTLLPALLVLLRPEPREGLAIGAALVRIVPPLVRRRWIAPAALVACVAATLGSLPFIETETNALRYLSASHPLRQETARLEAEGVGTSGVEILFRTGNPAPVLAKAHEEIGRLAPPVRGCVSLHTFVGSLALLGPLATELRHFQRPGMTRLTVRVDTVGVEGWHRLRPGIEEAARRAAAEVPGTDYEITGEFPLVMAVQENLLSTLLGSLGGTAATIFVILAVAHRSIRIGLLILLPSLAPLAFVTGACALFGIPLSVATVMVLAVTLGIVTDDSVHLLDVFRSGRSLESALRRVGTPVAETSMAILLGFLVCVGAEFVPTRQFGLLTAGGMGVALLADLVLFPALLGVRSESP